MKKFLFTALTICLLFTQNSLAQEKKISVPKVAIAHGSCETLFTRGFPNYKDTNAVLVNNGLDSLAIKLAASDKIELKVITSLDSIVSGKTDEEALKAVGADYLVVGTITALSNQAEVKGFILVASKIQTAEATLSVRVFDLSTGTIIHTAEAKGKIEKEGVSFINIKGKVSFDQKLYNEALSVASAQLVDGIVKKCTLKRE
ncbi:MAG: CsgG/HfaB family protein [Bacteroidales bacterium]|nr:CsgG/HfaB family protein [Bacteroidales bacterium]MDD4823136.1 CsgG/HfaB family protein [Bacteroidales bacterium]